MAGHFVTGAPGIASALPALGQEVGDCCGVVKVGIDNSSTLRKAAFTSLAQT